MTTLTAREFRQLKKDAQAFARTAQPGRTYYIVETAGGVKGGRFVNEIRFTKKALVGLMYGSRSPAGVWMDYGPIYAERDHPAIRNIPTWTEARESDKKFEAMMLGSPEWADEVAGVATGTRFRRQF